MSVDLRNQSLAQWYAEREQHRCGYCKNPSGSISYGMMTEQLTVDDYKDLIDRGWRRSGKYCYKPTMDKTCCPQYTIRCNALEFSLSKSHKRIIKKFNKFLSDGIFTKNVVLCQDQAECEGVSEIIGINKQSNININQVQILECDKKINPQDAVENNIGEPDKHFLSKSPDIGDNVVSDALKVKKTVNPGSGADPNKPPCKKAKLLRLERKKEKMLEKKAELNKLNSSQKFLNDLLGEISSTSKYNLKLTLVPTTGHEWDNVKYVEYELYKKYQIVVHSDSPEVLSLSGFTRFLVNSPLKLTLVSMTQDNTTFGISEQLYQKYQKYVHDEECDENEFYYFLVKTPLKPKPFPNGAEGSGYGSFHQQYWIDDKLIAVGVIDILPGCVSSVYFFYDPDYRNLTLGTYGTLRELQFVQNLQSQIPDLKYYYMGFYIHSCPKMRYKGKLKPSHLLCPETYLWQPIEKCLPKLDVSKYSRLNDDPKAKDNNLCTSADIKKIKLISHWKLYNVQTYLDMYDEDPDTFQSIACQVGKKSALKIIFWID